MCFKKLFDKYGLYSTDYKISSDYELFLRAFLDTPESFIHHDFTVCNFHLDGMSQNPANFAAVEKERLIIQQKDVPEKELKYYLKLRNRKKITKNSIIVWLRKYYLTRHLFNAVYFVYSKLR